MENAHHVLTREALKQSHFDSVKVEKVFFIHFGRWQKTLENGAGVTVSRNRAGASADLVGRSRCKLVKAC